jgi:hypothetical protein
MPSFDFTRWTRALGARGYDVLPASHAVPLSLWLRHRDPLDGRVLHFRARGTRLRLAVHEPSDLTVLILRAACDCEEHRQAGGTGRVVLNPGAVALEVHELDGAPAFGWTGHEAALLTVPEAAGIFESLLARVSHRAAPPSPERAETA